MKQNENKERPRKKFWQRLFAEAELQDSVRKKKNWDAWMESGSGATDR